MDILHEIAVCEHTDVQNIDEMGAGAVSSGPSIVERARNKEEFAA